MVKINLRDFYPFTQEDKYIEVSSEVAEMMNTFERAKPVMSARFAAIRRITPWITKAALNAASCSLLTRRRNCMEES